ncbi:MAG: tRNA (adenosine(37)-N6)-dimethylallyltransferase MiaA [Saprospiraceae bacterium]
MSFSNKYLIVVAGPTSAGKTEIAIQIARHFKTEIINADSRQFYKEMSIGTAKPDLEERTAAPHHFVDNLSIHQAYSVGDFEKDGLEKLDQLFQNHQIVVMSGGSGLYIKAICEGLDKFPDVPIAYREKWDAIFKEKGIDFLQEQLKILDPEYYEEVDLNNPVRLIRALSVSDFSGQAYSSFKSKETAKRPFEIIQILLEWPREVLYERINKKVDWMIKEGLEEEVKRLHPYKDLQALQTVAYSEFFEYFEGKYGLEETIEKIKMNSRRFAKRQMTWFRKMEIGRSLT